MKKLINLIETKEAKYNLGIKGIFINTEVTGYEELNEVLSLKLLCGTVEVTSYKEAKRPSNVIVRCKECYSLYNEENEFVGYIYQRYEGK